MQLYDYLTADKREVNGDFYYTRISSHTVALLLQIVTQVLTPAGSTSAWSEELMLENMKEMFSAAKMLTRNKKHKIHASSSYVIIDLPQICRNVVIIQDMHVCLFAVYV